MNSVNRAEQYLKDNMGLTPGAGIIRDLLTEIEKLKRDLDFELSTNNFDAKRLRRLATLVGVSLPESDETILGCAGTVLGSISRVVEEILNEKQISEGKCPYCGKLTDEKGEALITALLRFQRVWQKMCDGSIKLPKGKGFEDHRACYELMEAFLDFMTGLPKCNVQEKRDVCANWLILEKEYSATLGRIAQLCNTVIPWVLNQDLDEDQHIRIAADEIMQYVDAVRP